MEENDILIIIAQLLKEPFGTKDIEDALKIDIQTSFLTDRILNQGESEYSKTFLSSVKDILNNPESESKFVSNYKFPLEINGFSNQIYEKLKKIWDGQNRSVSVFPDDGKDNVVIDYQFYKNQLFEYYFKLPNTLVTVFKDLEGETKHHFIKSSEIVSFSKNRAGDFDHVLFSEGGVFWYFDRYVIVNFKKEEKNISIISIQENLAEKVNIFHVSNEKYNLKSEFVRTNKLGDYLASMVFLQMLYVFSKITDPYGFFLILQKFSKSNCNYRDNERGILCSGGDLYMTVENEASVPVIDNNNGHKKCPSCNQSTAPGSVIRKSELMAIGKANDVVEDMLSFIAPPTDSLKYKDDFLKNAENKLMQKICGETSKLNENTNHNAESVINSREGQETVLINLKSQFEPILNKIETAKAKFESDAIDSVWINLGTYFLVADVQTLYAELEQAQENNPENVLKIKERIAETENQTDYPEKKRALILLRFYPNVKEEMFPFASAKIKQKQAMYTEFVNWYELKNVKIGYDSSKDIQQTLIFMNAEFDSFLLENEVISSIEGINPI